MKSVQCIHLCPSLYFKGLSIKKTISVLWLVGKLKTRSNTCYTCACKVIVIVTITEHFLSFYILLRM